MCPEGSGFERCSGWTYSGNELSLVNVQVGATHATCFDLTAPNLSIDRITDALSLNMKGAAYMRTSLSRTTGRLTSVSPYFRGSE